jgi:hypothetical protein
MTYGRDGAGTTTPTTTRCALPATAPPPTGQHHPLLLTATFMTVLDFFIVNVAIPATQLDLSAGPRPGPG